MYVILRFLKYEPEHVEVLGYTTSYDIAKSYLMRTNPKVDPRYFYDFELAENLSE